MMGFKVFIFFESEKRSSLADLILKTIQLQRRKVNLELFSFQTKGIYNKIEVTAALLKNRPALVVALDKEAETFIKKLHTLFKTPFVAISQLENKNKLLNDKDHLNYLVKKIDSHFEKLKVLNVITRLDYGGSSDNTLHTTLLLDKNSFVSTLYFGKTETPTRLLNNPGVSEVEIVKDNYLQRELSLVKDFGAFVNLIKYLRKGQFQVIHLHTSKAGFLGRIATLMTLTPKIIYTPHGTIFDGYFGKSKTLFFTLCEKGLAPFTDIFIALTEGEKKDFLKRKIGSQKKFKTVFSGIDFRSFKKTTSSKKELKTQLGLSESSIVIGNVSRLTRVKDQTTTIFAFKHALKKNNALRLLLAGDGEDENMLKNLVQTNNLSGYVFFLGRRDDLQNIYPCLDLLILSSLNEGMGRVILEAFYFGIPVIATAVGGIPDLIKDGYNGLLFKKGNPREASEKIDFLLKNKKTRETFIKRNLKTIENFSAENMVKKLEKLYTGF